MNPTSLLHTVWFNNIQHFGQRGRQEHITMRMDNFGTCYDENGRKYITFREDPTKTRQHGLHPDPRVTDPKMFATGGDRCPVGIFEFYVSKRPHELRTTGRFYLTPKHDCLLSAHIWYKVTPVGKNKIGNFMKEMICGTEVEKNGKKITNYSGRKTLVKKLKQADVPESSIIKVTGHKTTRGLLSYDPGDQKEFQRMSLAISGPGSEGNSSSRVEQR